jgi:trk system potassium uptake protein TrkA
MKIVILGAGMVGATLAEQLVAEGHDIALVDLDEDLLSDISQRLDLKAVCGQASYPDVMREAGSEEADMVVAVTDNDEVNMVACQVAYSLFQVPLKIARIRTPHYFIRKELYSNDNLPIDVFINPEVMLTRHIRHLVDVPGCRQVLDFFGSRIRIVEVSINSDSAWCGRASVECLADHDNVRLAAVARDGVMLVATEGLTLQAGDQIFLAASSRAVIPMMASISGTLRWRPHWPTTGSKVIGKIHGEAH